MQLRASASAVPVASAAVEQAQSAAGKFQAAIILRDAVLRDWGSIPFAERTALRERLLSYALENHEALGSVVLNQLLQVVAVLAKRGWLDAKDEGGSRMAQSLLERATSLLPEGVTMQIVVGRLLSSLTNEFSFARSSSGPWKPGLSC